MFDKTFDLGCLNEMLKELQQQKAEVENSLIQDAFNHMRGLDRPISSGELADLTGIPARRWKKIMRNWYNKDENRAFVWSHCCDMTYMTHKRYYVQCDEFGNSLPGKPKIHSRKYNCLGWKFQDMGDRG